VIFSGGDPLLLPVAFLNNICSQLNDIPSLNRIRFHTRILGLDPGACDEEMMGFLKSITKQIVIVFHINHPREITPQLKELIQRLKEENVICLSQSVLLRGVNDSVKVLAELINLLAATGIQPYYLHQLDKAKGINHFRMSLSQGRALYRKLRMEVSADLLPEYMVELPKGAGKYPVTLLEKINNDWTGKDLTGNPVIYQDV
jgi:lysine 2,3-aminomutase